MKIVSFFTHLHVIPKLYGICSSVEHKRKHFEETVLVPINFHCMVKKYNATQSEPKLVAFSCSIRQLLCRQHLHTKITSPTIFLQSSAILRSVFIRVGLIDDARCSSLMANRHHDVEPASSDDNFVDSTQPYSPSNQQQTNRTKFHPTFFFFNNLLHLDVCHNMEEKICCYFLSLQF